MAVKESLAPVTQVKKRRSTSLWGDAWRRLIKNKAAIVGGVIIIVFVIMASFADTRAITIFTGGETQPLIAPKLYDKQDLLAVHVVPNWVLTIFSSMSGYVSVSNEYPLGSDYLGRDLLSRIIYGGRVSLAVAFIGPLISLAIGLIYGLVSGFAGGRIDNWMMRFVDIMYAFPGLLFIILLMSVFRVPTDQLDPETFRYQITVLDRSFGGMLFIFIGIGITAWMGMARLTRGQVLSLKEKEFIEAAYSIGASNLQIMRKHLLPNIIGPIIVAETLVIPSYILTEAFLSFIGLGVQIPMPSWGSMISEGAKGIRSHPYEVVFPAIALAVIMFAFNFLGDGLRDALDPRLKGAD